MALYEGGVRGRYRDDENHGTIETMHPLVLLVSEWRTGNDGDTFLLMSEDS